jgi:SET domain-containing protein
LKKNLFLKKSQLPKAGKGLFTREHISKGDSIVEYKGRLQSWNEIKHEDGYNGYILRVSRTMAINARPSRTLGRYANDAAGLSLVKGLRNNAEYVTYGNSCFIEALCPIKKGEEIFVSYGYEYWELMKRIFGA